MFYIDLRQGYSALPLQSDALAAPYQGAVIVHDPKGRQITPTGTVKEEIRISLEGTPAQLDRELTSLARWMGEIERVRRLAGAEQVYLEVQRLSGETVWRSVLLKGTVEVLGPGPGLRRLGSLGVRLLVERENYWEDAAETELFLASQASGRRQGGVTISNCWDAAHSNWVSLGPADSVGDLPAPVRLALTVNSLAANGTVYVGQNIHSNPGGLLPRVEGESALALSPATLTATVSAAQSAGSYGRFAWSGTGQAVLRFGIGSFLLGGMAGQAFLPMLRLANPIAAGETVWGFWRATLNVGANQDPLVETRPGILVNASSLQPGSPVCLPPWPVESGETLPAIDLELVLQASDSGAHTIDIDFAYFLPLEYWRVYRMTAKSLGGLVVHDNPYSGTLKSYGAMQGHQAEGPGVWVVPGFEQRYSFLIEAAGLGPLTHTASVRMYYRPRKVTL